MKFTAVIVFGATSSAGFSLSLSVGSPFWLAPAPPHQPSCWKVTPVYCACQEADTIYCTLVTSAPSNSTTSSFAAFYGRTRCFGVVSTMVLPNILSTGIPSRGKVCLQTCIGWMEPQETEWRKPIDFESMRRRYAGQCRRLVQYCGFVWKSAPPFLSPSSSNHCHCLRIYLNKQ